jgi:sarcosine oxidase gamma subunit
MGKGRPKGAINKTTAALKEAILLAAHDVGEEKAPGEGLVGYLKYVAREDVKAFSALLGKVLPMQVTGEDGGAIQVTWLKPD